MDNTKAQAFMPFMEPEINIVEVLETRNILFKQAFTENYVQQIIEVLNKIEKYDELMQVTDKEKYIRITLATPGGNVFSLLGLLEKIETLKSKGYLIHTHVKNMAASCGFILFVGGNYRTMSEFSYLLNHQGSSMARGTLREMEVDLELSKKLEKQFNDYIRKNTTLSEEEINKPYATNTDIWYNAEEALKLNLVNEIVNY